MSATTATRYHDFSCGHRVANHESKCAFLHGHNYRVHFTVSATELDAVGRVMDFSVIAAKLCRWLEDHWDHRFLCWQEDAMMQEIMAFAPGPATTMLANSLVFVPFNPTAENMAEHLLHVVGPKQLAGTGCHLIAVSVEETRKCSAAATLAGGIQ